MPKNKILMPIPSRDFDPSEVAVSWWVLKQQGFDIEFATPDAKPGQCDEMMLTGRGLDPWGFIPGLHYLRMLGLMLRANAAARHCYSELEKDSNFLNPQQWVQMDALNYDGLLLPGGHRARGMREYLESKVLQNCVTEFFSQNKPVGAICHGVLLAARSIDPKTNKSILWGKKTTALTWKLESTAASITKFTRFWDPNYYRTYLESTDQPKGYMSVQQEVSRALKAAEDFQDVPQNSPNYRRKTSGFYRDTINDSSPAFVVRDELYVSARWPGDVFTFAKTFAGLFK